MAFTADESSTAAVLPPSFADVGLTERETAIALAVRGEIAAGLVQGNTVAVITEVIEEVSRVEGLTPTKRKAMIKRIMAVLVDHDSEVYKLQDSIVEALKSASKQRFGFGNGQGFGEEFVPEGPVGDVVKQMLAAAVDPSKIRGAAKRHAVEGSLVEGTAQRLFRAGLTDALVEYSTGSTDFSKAMQAGAIAAAESLVVDIVASKCFGFCKGKKAQKGVVAGGAGTGAAPGERPQASLI